MNIENWLPTPRFGRRELLRMYEEILIANGIHYPMTKLGFETCYKRYQVLGGKKEFKFMGSQNGIA
tara:strand:+ start:799 stop:996 length:198 start_codon:yes stop_codon:yes gene_type:complete